MGHVFETGSSYILIFEDSATLERSHFFTIMAQIFLVVFIICIIGIIATLGWIFIEPPTSLKVRDLKIGRRKFVQITLNWCCSNLGTINHPYQLKIHYYRHKKYGGRFLFNSKQIVIYVYDDLTLEYIVETVIHEFYHFIQLQKKAHEQDYNKKHYEVGYWNNPFEIEARKVAMQHRENCLKWVLKQI